MTPFTFVAGLILLSTAEGQLLSGAKVRISSQFCHLELQINLTIFPWFCHDSVLYRVHLHSHVPSIRSHRGTSVVWPDFQPMSVPKEPVCIDLCRQNPVFTSLHILNLQFMSYRLRRRMRIWGPGWGVRRCQRTGPAPFSSTRTSK